MTALVIFDVDGTLVDNTYLHALAWSRGFAAEGLFVPAWRVHRSIGMGGDKLVRHLLGEAVEERQGDALRDRWREEYDKVRDEVRPLPGAAKLVRHVHELGLSVALASSGERDFVDQAVALLDIAAVVDVILTKDDVDASKPDPDLLQVTLATAGTEQAVMVGDSPYDVIAAARIGLATVCFRTGGFHEAELRSAGAVEVLDEPREALDLPWRELMRDADAPPR